MKKSYIQLCNTETLQMMSPKLYQIDLSGIQNVSDVLQAARDLYPDKSAGARAIDEVALYRADGMVMFATKEGNDDEAWSVYFSAHDIFSECPITTIYGSPAIIAASLLALDATVDHMFEITDTTEKEWYVLVRDEETQIVSVTIGNDPLYGRGSWGMYSGPHASYEKAGQVLAPVRKR